MYPHGYETITREDWAQYWAWLKRKAVALWGWVRWQVWYRLYARTSIELYEQTGMERNRRAA